MSGEIAEEPVSPMVVGSVTFSPNPDGTFAVVCPACASLKIQLAAANLRINELERAGFVGKV